MKSVVGFVSINVSVFKTFGIYINVFLLMTCFYPVYCKKLVISIIIDQQQDVTSCSYEED